MNDSFCKQSMYLLWSEGKEGVFFTVKKGLCFTSIHHSYFSRNEQGKNKDLLHTTLSCSCNSQAAKFMAYIELKCVFIRFQPVKNKIIPTVLNFIGILTLVSLIVHTIIRTVRSFALIHSIPYWVLCLNSPRTRLNQFSKADNRC